MPVTLLLTATITPPTSGVPGLVRTDASLRLQDYLTAFEFYLKQPSDAIGRIVLADNSASDVAPFRELADKFGQGKEVHATSHQGLDYEPGLGRGYGEMRLLDELFTNYEPVAGLPADAPIWKGTGRYMLINIAACVRAQPPKFDLYCDLKNKPHHRFDMRFFAFTPAGYRRIFLGKYRAMREMRDTPDGPLFVALPEVQMREFVDPLLAAHDPGVIPRFRVEPYVEGVRGWDNVSYSKGKGMLKYALRAGTRKLAPKVWI